MVRRARFPERGGMATYALRRQAESIELPDSSYFVTGVAVHNRMRANEWKPVLMLVDVMNRDLPAVGVVT